MYNLYYPTNSVTRIFPSPLLLPPSQREGGRCSLYILSFFLRRYLLYPSPPSGRRIKNPAYILSLPLGRGRCRRGRGRIVIRSLPNWLVIT